MSHVLRLTEPIVLDKSLALLFSGRLDNLVF